MININLGLGTRMISHPLNKFMRRNLKIVWKTYPDESISTLNEFTRIDFEPFKSMHTTTTITKPFAFYPNYLG